MSRTHLHFILNDREVRLERLKATDMLLDHLRLAQGLTGTKEGCAEGDCGACTVLVGDVDGGELRYRPVNACIRPLASVDACHVVTVEHLRGATGGLHPVQEAMVEHHGAQCGFCTPGIVMALAARWLGATDAPEDTREALQGNLCRCTGYAPILRAAEAADAVSRDGDPILTGAPEMAARLTALRGDRVELRDGEALQAILPADLDDLAEVTHAHPDATLVAGATDVGLWVTKGLRNIAPAVHLAHLPELTELRRDGDALTIGAGVTYAQAQEALTEALPALATYWPRIGGWQVRAAGTIGGNIANGSPIGDTPPLWIALGATLHLRHGATRRDLAVEEFFLDYGKQDRAAGEIVTGLTVPLPGPNTRFAAYKISKRRDEDISALACALAVEVSGGVIAQARIAFGGMAGTPKRAQAAETALTGAAFTAESFEAAAAALPQDFTPLTDARASADYRMLAAQNLLRRFWLAQPEAEAAA